MGILQLVLTVFCSLAVVGLGLLTYFNNTHSKANKSFLGMCFGLSVWIVSNYFADNGISGLFWSRTAFSAIVISTAFFSRFTTSYPVDKHVSRLKKQAVLVFSVLTILVTQTPYFIPKTYIVDGLATVEPGLLYVVFPVYLLSVFGSALLLLLRKSSSYDPETRARVRLVAMGTILVASVGMFTNLLLPSIVNTNKYASIGTFSTFLFIAFTTYAIVRHHLFDIKAALARTFGYVVSLGTLALVYGLLTYLVLDIFLSASISAGEVPRYFYVGFALLTALMYQPIARYFNRVTSRLFYRDAYEPQTLLDDLNKTLVSTISLRPMLSECGRILQKNLTAEFCVFAIKTTGGKEWRIFGDLPEGVDMNDTVFERVPFSTRRLFVLGDNGFESQQLAEYMRRHNIAVVRRLASGVSREDAHFMLLGFKKNGSSYSGQDVRIIDIMANELVIAVQNALRFDEIERFNETLREKVAHATYQLSRTNEKLRMLDATKDEFISLASHQLRTPLTSVKGYVSMVLDGDAGSLTPLQQKLLNQAFISSQRMVYLIADLLNVSRLRTGKFVIEPVACNLAEATDGEVKQLAETAKLRDLELTYDKPAHFLSYMLDETKLRQVIMNFIDNSIYYTPAGGHIDVLLADKPHAIELTVTDDGIGVPTHEQHHLFTKFFRAGNAKQARPDGTGLGLFMAKKVVIAHGGAIIFRSKEGKGSTFGFSLPKSNLQPAQESTR